MSDLMNLVVILSLLTQALSSLTIQSPLELAKLFENKYQGSSIPYSIANYGVVPYGKTLSGEVGTPSVLEDCVYEELPSGESKSILLVERNDCTFTQKSINVQLEGGKLALIMDNLSQDPNRIVMVDDGRGSQVKIPTLLISHEDGLNILNFLSNSSVVISVTFEVEVREKAILQLWIDIAEHQNFVFLRKLQPFFAKIKEHINLKVAYPTRRCYGYCIETDCFYNSTYCRSDVKYIGIEKKGQLLIQEQLRQYYISQISVDRWWDYVLAYDEYCQDLSIVDKCSEQLMKKYGIEPSQINKMVSDSFGKEDNSILHMMEEIKFNNSIVYYPSVIVNSIVYRGNLQPFDIYELICDSLNDIPEGCSGYIESSKTLQTWVIFVIALVVIFIVFLVVCFRRIARRQVSEKINSQVNELVNQYITMYENERFEKGERNVEMKQPLQS